MAGNCGQKTFQTPGFTRVRKRLFVSKLSHKATFELNIQLPPEKQLSKVHPELIARLQKDWGIRLSELKCSTGDFGKALAQGEVNLAHIWAEIYSICLDETSSRYGLGHIDFRERYEYLECGQTYSKCQIELLFDKPIPQIVGLRELVTAYLNCAIAKKPFDIRGELDRFVSEGIQKRRKGKCFISRLFIGVYI